MAGEQTRIGLWRPQVGLFGGAAASVHFALHIAPSATTRRWPTCAARAWRSSSPGIPQLRRQPGGLYRRARRERRRAVDLGRRPAPHFRRMTIAPGASCWCRGGAAAVSGLELMQRRVAPAREAPTMALSSTSQGSEANLLGLVPRLAGTGWNRESRSGASRGRQPVSDQSRSRCRQAAACIGACIRRWRQELLTEEGTFSPAHVAAQAMVRGSAGTAAAWRWRIDLPSLDDHLAVPRDHAEIEELTLVVSRNLSVQATPPTTGASPPPPSPARSWTSPQIRPSRPAARARGSRVPPRPAPGDVRRTLRRRAPGQRQLRARCTSTRQPRRDENRLERHFRRRHTHRPRHRAPPAQQAVRP